MFKQSVSIICLLAICNLTSLGQDKNKDLDKELKLKLFGGVISESAKYPFGNTETDGGFYFGGGMRTYGFNNDVIGFGLDVEYSHYSSKPPYIISSSGLGFLSIYPQLVLDGAITKNGAFRTHIAIGYGFHGKVSGNGKSYSAIVGTIGIGYRFIFLNVGYDYGVSNMVEVSTNAVGSNIGYGIKGSGFKVGISFYPFAY